nr:DNA topoisomerase [Candidatus Sigynarchaeota archaeon]
KILLELYYAGIITYPNLQKTPHSARVDHVMLAQRAMEISEFEDAGRMLHETGIIGKEEFLQRANVRVEKGICPIVAIDKDDATFKEKMNHWKIYATLFNRYLMGLFPPARVTKNNVKIDLDGFESFSLPSYTITDEGFHQFFKDSRLDELPRFDVNVLKSLEIVDVNLVEAKIQDYYTDASLLKSLHKHVDAVSYLLMVEKLISNNYIQVVNKNLKLTKRGVFIATFLDNTFDFLGADEFTGFFSGHIQGLELTTAAELDTRIDEARKVILDRYLSLFKTAREKTNAYLLKQGIDFDSLDEHASTKTERRFQLPPEYHVFCVDCGSPMKIIETKTKARFLACENRLECGRTAALPKDGKITVLNKQCALCNKHVLKIESQTRGAYFFYPTCWMDAYKANKPGTKGICTACDEVTSCWLENQDATEQDIEVMVDLVQRHRDAFETCPRCQVAPMILI